MHKTSLVDEDSRFFQRCHCWNDNSRLLIFIPCSSYNSCKSVWFFGGGGAIDDLAAFAEDMDEEQKNTNAGKSFNSRPYGAFKALGQTVCAVLPLVQSYEMFT